jgi:hypothetical protein
MSYVRLADALAAERNKSEALASYRDALAILQRLSTSDADNPRWQPELAAVQAKIAGLGG